VQWLASRSVKLIDCQVRTEHLVRFGAHDVPRAAFLRRLAALLRTPTLRGRWSLEDQEPTSTS